MAGFLQGISNEIGQKVSFRPQSFTSTGAGLAVDISPFGSNQLSAMISTGAVSSFTSLVVKVQVATDSAFSTPVDVTGAVFTTVSAANSDPECIDFYVPPVASATAAPYQYVRLYATLTGTSIVLAGYIQASNKMPQATSGYQATPATLN